MAGAGGRPLEFDPDEALTAVLGVFWTRGYADTNLDHIEAATGLSRPSLYNTFGNKRALFEKAVDRYVSLMAEFVDRHLRSGTEGLADIERFVAALVAEYHNPEHAPGCLMINAIATHGDSDEFVADRAGRYRRDLAAGITRALERAGDRGEIDPASVPVLRDRIMLYLYGLNLMARTGDTRATIVDYAAAMTSDFRLWSAATAMASSSRPDRPISD